VSDLEPADSTGDDEVELVDDDEDTGLGGLDLGALLGQAQAMQQQLMDAQAEVAARVVEGQSGGGVVKVEVTGGWEFQSVTISPEAGDDVELLADLVLAALRDATSRVNDLHAESVGEVDLGGLGGLGGLLGG
jgi:DNA-binding YbaB/EbfC family protein